MGSGAGGGGGGGGGRCAPPATSAPETCSQFSGIHELSETRKRAS